MSSKTPVVHMFRPNWPSGGCPTYQTGDIETLLEEGVNCEECKPPKPKVIHKSLGRTTDRTKCGSTRTGVWNCFVVRPWNGLVKITCSECNKHRPFDPKAETRAKSSVRGIQQSYEQGLVDGKKYTLDALKIWLSNYENNDKD